MPSRLIRVKGNHRQPHEATDGGGEKGGYGLRTAMHSISKCRLGGRQWVMVVRAG